MMQAIVINDQQESFCTTVSKESRQDILKCYQCGKCTAGCPLAFAMDFPPNQVMRMVQLNMENEVLNSEGIWLCAYCSTCTVRCPREISVADIMDSLRIMARQKGMSAPSRGRKVALFSNNFLETVKKFGRSYELGSTLMYNLKGGRPFQNAGLGLKMFKRGKIKLLASKIKGAKEVENIFKRANQVRKGA